MVTKITRNSERWTKQHKRRILRRVVREPVRYGCNSVNSTNCQAAHSHRKCLFYRTTFASRVRAHQSGLYQRAEKINRTSRRNFKRNFKEHENKDRCQEISISKQFKCPFCCFQANTLREIKTHKSRHDQCKKRICPTCSREFHRLHSLRCHMDKCNDIKSKRLKCPWCEFVCSSRGEAEGHIRNHEETCKSYLCTVDTCTFWSKWLQSLRAHTKRQHAKMKTESQENLVTDQAVMIPKKNQHCSLHQSTSGLMIDTKAQSLATIEVKSLQFKEFDFGPSELKIKVKTLQASPPHTEENCINCSYLARLGKWCSRYIKCPGFLSDSNAKNDKKSLESH